MYKMKLDKALFTEQITLLNIKKTSNVLGLQLYAYLRLSYINYDIHKIFVILCNIF